MGTGVVLTGIVNSVRPIVADNGSYQFCALDISTSRGAALALQMWPGAPQYQQVFETGEALVNHKVRVSVSNYSAGSYKLKDGTEKHQVRLRVLDIHDLGIPEDDSEIVGTVTSARALAEHNFLALEIVTSRGITYPCQMWDNDPQYVALGPLVDQLVDHKVKATILGCSAGKRTMKDGSTKLQARFRITNVRDLGVPMDETE